MRILFFVSSIEKNRIFASIWSRDGWENQEQEEDEEEQ